LSKAPRIESPMMVYVETHGCSTNQALGEYLEGMLLSKGFQLAADPEMADWIVLNTCTVKGRTERRMLRRIRELRTRHGGSRLVIAGCMPSVQADLILTESPDSLLFGTDQYSIIPDALLGQTSPQREATVPFGQRPFHRPGIGVIPISTGCLGRCTYCIVRIIKGALHSYPAESILQEVRRVKALGAHELWLTSQDLAAYGRDGGETSLPDLLERILKEAGETRIRLGMMNPSTAAPILDDLLEAFQDPRVYAFLHLPVQSGSNRILEAMKRDYRVEDWLGVVDRLRSEIPRFAVATDIIVGYPEESPSDFEETLDVLREANPDIVNLSRYEHRPGTPASRLRPLPGAEVKRRSRIASSLISDLTLDANRRWLGWQGHCLVSEKAPRGGYVARNRFYKPILIEGGEPLGSFIEVKVIEARENYLLGSREIRH